MGLSNACIQLVGVEGSYYFFSISRSALDQQPWRDGIVYLLPAASFENQKSIMDGDQEIRIAQVASLTPRATGGETVRRTRGFSFPSGDPRSRQRGASRSGSR
jgi:hypothetical protein